MNTVQAKGGFKSANPHALATILEASETRSIIAANDIFDIRGIKLWARNQPVSRALQERLMDRSLSQPLETCLIAEDGVSNTSLKIALEALMAAEGPLSPLLKPHAAVLLRGTSQLRLHPVVQLMLTACETARPAAFSHAIEAMALAGSLMKAQTADDRLVAVAMMGGLLHDIGEMYIAPEFDEADADKALDVETYRQLVVHPHIGQLLLTQLTDYPKDLARAVGEHHEHLDGSGYPHLLQGEQLSALGKLLGATEAALAALRVPGATLHHASVALRVVPGEFDGHLAGPLSAAARSVAPMTARQDLDDLHSALAQLDVALQTGMTRLDTILPPQPSEGLLRAAELSRYLLHKLRSGWNESGLWSPGAIGQEQAAEAEAVLDELKARLFAIERIARLSAGQLPVDEQDQLDALCRSLVAGVN